MDANTMQALMDRVEIGETLVRYGRSADRREWETLIGLMSEEIDLDYGQLERVAARKLVLGRWAPVFRALDATQHLVGPPTVVVDGDGATATAYFQATHVMVGAEGGDEWTLGGSYDFALIRGDEGWRISGVTMTPIWQSGNGELMAQASARGAGERPA